MKKFFSVSAFFLLLVAVASAQENQWLRLNSPHKSGIQPMGGWYPSGIRDTISTEIVITDTTTHALVVIQGYAIRQRMDFSGDPMPIRDYSPYWRVENFLDGQKHELPPKLVWMSRASNGN